ncbi:lactoylglutathione lyase [Xaviernesmea oryzae]|uniref:Lactoylglutathione lyase n=1 Tax=Xaviernesmea oryzae TaxID=464029 RepID=A0A1Q9AXB2_9HYPH|nr:VOC family protein [Xaviernesmea oryzae]OLP60070.1 lactoylglutathione lyase [Xaviernesmea oryzae]SEK37808.1 Glyoxalase-like domain-containing protein [Xaviernesmea oryzae]
MASAPATTAQARRLDHLVLPVEMLDIARVRLQALGFTVAADALHPFGTENACIFFADGTYLEPLAIASREDCEAAARTGNVFVARDQAFRFRRGPEGLSALVVASDNAEADHARFVANGISGGQTLDFSRVMRLPDGSEGTGSFRLAFAADLRAPDLFFFACQRLQALPSDRAALERHANGVTGIARVVLTEDNPSDFQYLLQEVFEQRAIAAHSFGVDIEAANAAISVLTPEAVQAFFGEAGRADGERGLRGFAVVFRVASRAALQAFLVAQGVAFRLVGPLVVVPPAPGQGVLFAFGE